MTCKATFLFGLPDSRTVTVSGYAKDSTLSYSWDGNTDFHNYVEIPAQDCSHIFIIWHAEPPRKITRPNVLINCINDPDINGNSLKKAVDIKNSIIGRWPDVAVFNDPEKIWNTSRDRIYELYRNLPHLKIPRTIRLKPDSDDNVIKLAEVAGLKMPFIMRPCGTHQSEGLNLITNKKQLERYAYDGREFYIAEFVDYRAANGLYHKARLVMIGDEIYPRHYMTGQDWMVHGDLHADYMANDEASKKAEENFINNFESIIKPEALPVSEG